MVSIVNKNICFKLYGCVWKEGGGWPPSKQKKTQEKNK